MLSLFFARRIPAVAQVTLAEAIDKQAQYFGRFLGGGTGIPLQLIPGDQKTDNIPHHFVIEGENRRLSANQKLGIINWLLENRPSWILRFWRDRGFEYDIIDMNSKGQFCVQSTDLLSLTFSLDPAQGSILKNLEKKLNDIYGHELEVVSTYKQLFLISKKPDFNYDSFWKILTQDIEGRTGLEIVAGPGTTSKRLPFRVYPERLQITSDESSDTSVIPLNEPSYTNGPERYSRHNKIFVCENKMESYEGLTVLIRASLSTLLSFTGTQAPEYLNPPGTFLSTRHYRPSIETHPVLKQTLWRFAGIFFNGVRIDTHEKEQDYRTPEEVLGLAEAEEQSGDRPSHSPHP